MFFLLALPQISFLQDWELSKATVTSEAPVQGSKVVRMESGGRLTFRISKPATDRKMVFAMWFKGTEDNQWISVDAKARNGERPAQIRVNTIEGYVTTQYARVSKEWKPYSKSIVFSRSAKSATLEIENISGQPLYVAAPSFKRDKPEMCDLDGPGVLRASSHVWVQIARGSHGGVVTFPVPIKYRGQVPLAIKVWGETVKSYKFRKREDGLNWLCEVQVGGDGLVTWEALVYTRPIREPKLPLAKMPVAPGGSAAWLRRTSPIQTESPLVREAAKKLVADDPDVETYARRVAAFTCKNRGAGGPWTKLDAITALTCQGGGSCTNRANLAAALLRIRGIPARTVAHLPTWALGEPLFVHWLVEYWHPNVGWVSLESTWGEFRPPSYVIAVIAISSPEDEDGSYDPLQTRWVLPGAPKWAVPYIGKGLIPDLRQNQQQNWAKPEKRIEGYPLEIDDLFDRASQVFETRMKTGQIAAPSYYKRIEAAMKVGLASRLKAAL